MKFRLTLMSIVLCLSVAAARPGLAQQLQPQDSELVQQMLADGWEKVADGVLQRGVGGSRVETFTYNQEGLRWLVQRMEERVSFLENEYRSYPSAELARLIDSLKGEILAAEASLSAPQPEPIGAEEIQNCNISYGANAYADPLTGSSAPGVTASANANFSSTCGYLGHTYAYAYARAAIGTTITTKIQEDPRYNGTAHYSSASATVQGNLDCYSYAYGRANSDQLGISYATEDTNYACPTPPPPPVAAISGPTEVYTDDYTPCADVTWTASASGGTPGYSFEWYIGTTYLGSGSSLTRRYCQTNENVSVRVIVRDTAGQSDDEYFTTYIYYLAIYDPCSDPYNCNCGYNNDPYRPYDMERRICN